MHPINLPPFHLAETTFYSHTMKMYIQQFPFPADLEGSLNLFSVSLHIKRGDCKSQLDSVVHSDVPAGEAGEVGPAGHKGKMRTMNDERKSTFTT